MHWVTIPAIVSAVIGIISGVRGLRTLRTADPPQAEFTWKQAPLSPWKYETPTMVAITLHTISLVCFTVLILLSVDQSTLFSKFSLAISSLLLSVLALFATFFTPYATGVAVAYHFAQSWISPITYGAGADGMIYGSVPIPWRSFSHYEMGPDDGLISLFSSYSPAIRTWAIQPSADSFSGVLSLIQRHVPSRPHDEEAVSWLRSPFMLIAETTTLAFVPLVPAIWGWRQEQPWAWVYGLAAYFFVQFFGIRLFTIFDGRGGSPETESISQ